MGNQQDKSKFNLLYHNLSKELTKLTNEYNFLFEEDEKINYLFQELLFEIYINNSNEQKEYYIKLLKKSLEAYIKKNQQNQDKISYMVDNYINKNLTIEENLLISSKKISDFIKKYNLNLTPDTCIELIKNNQLLSLILKKVIESKRKIDEDSPLAILIEIYCMLNDIEINKEINPRKEKNPTDTDNVNISCLNDYLNQLDKPILSAEEEIELFKRLETGDILAKNLIIESNLKWVVKVAKRFQHKGLELEDLIQEGNIGLITAVEKYDYKKGFRFTTYATPWIKQAIRNGIYQTGAAIRLPSYLQEKIQKIEQTKDDLIQKLGREVTSKELSEELDIKVERIEAIQTYQNKSTLVSLNSFVGPDKETELENLVLTNEPSPEDIFIENIQGTSILDIFESCNLSEKEIIIMSNSIGLNGEPKSLTEISEMLDVSRERTRQLQNKALKKIRKSGYANELLKYTLSPNEAKRNLELYRQYYKENPKSLKSLQKEGGLEELESILKTKTLTKIKRN